MKTKILSFKYSPEFNKHYASYLPEHSEYLTLQEFQLILKELDNYQPSGMSISVFWFILFPFIAMFTFLFIASKLNVKEFPEEGVKNVLSYSSLFSVLAYYYLDSSKTSRHQRYVKIVCVLATSIVSGKGLIVEPGIGNQVDIYCGSSLEMLPYKMLTKWYSIRYNLGIKTGFIGLNCFPLMKQTKLNFPIKRKAEDGETSPRKQAKQEDIVFLFTHGAGGGLDTKPSQTWIELLGRIGIVHPLEYSYVAKKKPPSRMPTLVEEQIQEYLKIKELYPGKHIVMAGRSMGSRVACHASTDNRIDPLAIVCLSYPLIGNNKSVRDEILKEMTCPTLFVQGTRDKMCPIDQLESILNDNSRDNCEIFVFEGGDHSLNVLKRQPKSLDSIQKECLLKITGFCQSKYK
ncbi:hypothetical protein HK103_005449 [Boothiomyces macroporosus]|uniref:KANL3/Tex30 alpha/beta hydrolase-like domain-containing protein n=1 Tax=Boothiomyces macroporosus TaxID=261099 RepID=A0AAD5YAY3_9FUNG|nr:hypothetical protein HK103_005449 [Boothiomyces macroporosus]